ncbi:hypothetical protein GCM10022243_18910 [Saccharothrix violaceirubra]
MVAGIVAGLVVAGLVVRGAPPSVPSVGPADRTTERVLRPWGELPADARPGSGVAVTGSGDVVFLHRAGGDFASDTVIDTDPLLVLTPDGVVRTRLGAGKFKSPHGVSVDAEGRIWVTDVMTNRVTAFNGPTLGHDYGPGLDTCLSIRNELTNLPCTGDPEIFARPTDVAVSSDRHAFVADGYRNSRVAVFDDDRFALEWGGLGDRPGEFHLPHGIALRKNGDVVVADRRNARVQVFAPDGRHRATYASAAIGRPYDVAVGPDDALYVLDGGDALDEDGGGHRGYVVSMDDNGSVKDRWRLADQNADPHQLAVGPRGELYVAALNGPPLYRWTP